MTFPADKHNTKLMQGLALHQQGKLPEARALYEAFLISQPRNADGFHLLGIVLAQLNESVQAIDAFDKAIKLNPNNSAFYCNRGNAYFGLSKFEESIKDYGNAIKLSPEYIEAHFNLGNAYYSMGSFEEAVKSYGQVVHLSPDHVLAWKRRAESLARIGKHQEAILSLEQVIRCSPQDAESYYYKGVSHHALEQNYSAIESYRHAIKIKPDYIDALNNLGILLNLKEQFNESLDVFKRITEIKFDYIEAYNNIGSVLTRLGRHKEALLSYNRAIELQPEYYEAHLNRSLTLAAVGQYEDAITGYNKAIALDPQKPEPYYNRAIAFQALKYAELALDSYNQAIDIKPDHAKAIHNKGIALFVLKRWAEAIDSFEQAKKIDPETAYLDGMLLHTKMWLCHWVNYQGDVRNLNIRILEGRKASLSFPLLSLVDSLEMHRKAAEVWIADQWPPKFTLGEIPKKNRSEKIRLGYFSSDFRQHPVSILLAELFETHNRDRFELFAFSTGPDTGDSMRRRVKTAFDYFIDITRLTDKDAAQLVRQWGIDIAVDLSGHTQDSRSGVFAYRAAPIQLSYIGYLGTMGAEYYDYLLADQTLIPETSRSFYSEKIAYLPSYQVSDSKRKIADHVFSRKELGLPDHGFVFCCFNNNYKITPITFDQWMKILSAVPGSVIVLYVENITSRENLCREAESRGIDPNRIIFAERLPYEQHLARYRAMDLFLDTLPYNAGATASDALWAGLPVLTQMGETFPSRYAASLLNAIGLPELITESPEDYVALAIQLATHPEKLKQIKVKLERNRLSTALFNTKKFTQSLEAAYQAMYDRYQADLPPDHLVIEG